MKIEITTVSIVNGIKDIKKEILDKDDIRLDILKKAHTMHETWKFLGFQYDYACSETKYGFRVTKTARYSEELKETVFTYYNYI